MGISTARGDAGITGLLSGERISKDHPRIECLGVLDELSAFLGDARCAADHEHTREIIAAVQEDLITMMGILAASHNSNTAIPEEGRIAAWVREIETRHPMRGFVVPGANPSQAKLHVARTVCRRAERRIITLARTEPVDPAVLHYMNRLSDLIFMLSRLEENAPA
jgi:cob(I)alamin adenosyltransferase